MADNQQPVAPENFQICEGYACYAPADTMSLKQAVALITTAIIFARDNKIRRLLIDATQLSGFQSPSVADRYWIVRHWAAESQNLVEVAFTLPRYVIDPERFGVQVAINLGMRTDVFESRAEAIVWLLSAAKPRLVMGVPQPALPKPPLSSSK